MLQQLLLYLVLRYCSRHNFHHTETNAGGFLELPFERLSDCGMVMGVLRHESGSCMIVECIQLWVVGT